MSTMKLRWRIIPTGEATGTITCVEVRCLAATVTPSATNTRSVAVSSWRRRPKAMSPSYPPKTATKPKELRSYRFALAFTAGFDAGVSLPLP